MKLRMTVECLVFLAVVAMAGNLGAQPVGANPWALAQAPNYWGLTAEQTSQIQGIVTKWQEEMQPLWASLQTKNIELQSLMWQATPDRSAVETLAREVGEIQAQIQGKSLERRNAIRGVLTAEQQTLSTNKVWAQVGAAALVASAWGLAGAEVSVAVGALPAVEAVDGRWELRPVAPMVELSMVVEAAVGRWELPPAPTVATAGLSMVEGEALAEWGWPLVRWVPGWDVSVGRFQGVACLERNRPSRSRGRLEPR